MIDRYEDESVSIGQNQQLLGNARLLLLVSHDTKEMELVLFVLDMTECFFFLSFLSSFSLCTNRFEMKVFAITLHTTSTMKCGLKTWKLLFED